MAKQAKRAQNNHQGTDDVPQPKPLQISGNTIIAHLSTRFCKAADESIAFFPQQEQLVIIDHFVALLVCLGQYHKAGEDEALQTAIFQEYADKEQELLRKYGRLLQMFRSKKFNDYFDLDEIVSIYQLVSKEQYEAAIGDGPTLTQAGTPPFVWLCRNHIFSVRDQYLLAREPVLSTPSMSSGTGSITAPAAAPDNQQAVNIASAAAGSDGEQAERPDKEATRARQLLAIYYFLLAQGIEGRATHEIAPIVRFAHLLLGIEYDGSDSNGLYKKYLRMPNVKTDAYLLKDLKYIRGYFEALDMEKALVLIDAEITRASKASSPSARKSR